METVASAAEGIRGQARRVFLRKDVCPEVSSICCRCGSGEAQDPSQEWSRALGAAAQSLLLDVKPRVDRDMEWGRW